MAALVHRRLPVLLACLACALVLPSLGLGFQLDDYAHRYMLSELPGGAELLHVYGSPFGIANGERVDNLWQIEHGYAPWWTHPDLLVSLYRPLSELSHRLDAALFPKSAPLQHLHSVLWFFALVLLTAWLYRSLFGVTTVAGLAAVLFALDHTHGFAVGWIANRNAVIAATLGTATLLAYLRARRDGSLRWLLVSTALFAAALLAGEGSVAVLGYVLGHALFVDRAPRARRVLAVLPHLLVVIGWRVVYVALDRGARHSGLYLDPLGEPLAFALAALERVPMLVLGQLALPPAEAIMFVPPPWRALLIGCAVAFCGLVGRALAPLLRHDGRARMLGLGALGALVLASSTHPNNRLLFYVGLGAMPLLGLLWHAAVERTGPGATVVGLSRVLVAALVGLHLLVSPLLLPATACSVALTAGASEAARSVAARAQGADVVIVSSPDYFYVKLVPVLAALEGFEPPAHLSALSFGEVPLVVSRKDAHTLEVEYRGGLLASPLLELYRARGEPMPVGARVALSTLEVEVTALTPDGRIAAARFRFARPLEDAGYRFFSWSGKRYARFDPPRVGGRVAVAGAALPFGF